MTPRERAWLRRWIDAHADPNADADAQRDLIRVRAIVDRAARDADEAERVREAVATERERMGLALADAIELADEGWGYVDNYFRTKWDFAARITDLRARATSPAPCVCGCPASEHDARNIVGEIERDCAAHGCERYYGSTCTLGVPGGVDPEPALAAHPADRAATDAAKAARARGEDVYADGEGRCEVVPEPVAAERAVVEALCGAIEQVCAQAVDKTGEYVAFHAYAVETLRDALAAARKGGG